MKEATGELSMTVVVIIAVIAILSILTYFLMPRMKNYISESWGQMSNSKTDAANAGTNMR